MLVSTKILLKINIRMDFGWNNYGVQVLREERGRRGGERRDLLELRAWWQWRFGSWLKRRASTSSLAFADIVMAAVILSMDLPPPPPSQSFLWWVVRRGRGGSDWRKKKSGDERRLGKQMPKKGDIFKCLRLNLINEIQLW